MISLWIFIPLVIFVGYYFLTQYGHKLTNKKILIKRISPEFINLVGDLTLKTQDILVMYRGKEKKFPLTQIKQIKAYSITDWGLTEYEQIDIILDKGYLIKLDASLEEHRNFVQSLLQQLGIGNKAFDWGFLPQQNDKFGRCLIFERNTIC